MADNTNEETEAEFDQDVFDSMLYGTFEEEAEVEDQESDTNEGVEDEADTAEDDNQDDNDDQEDTDQEEDSEDDEDLDEAGDGELDEDSEDEEDDEEEDSLVDDNDSDDENGDVEDEDKDADEADDSEDEDTDEESEDDTDTEDEGDGTESETTDEIDYKKFYDSVVNREFVVNGKKVKGFSDPDKIIQSQQMAGGFSEKMAGFKQYRPFMSPLKDRGMLDDQAKFDLAMNLIDGDKEAIKQHLQSLSIDPMDLDMEKIDYSGKSNVATQESLVIEDVMERAKASGVEDRVRQVVGKDWDGESFQEFVSNDAVRNDLLSHIESGAFENVQDKIAEMSRLDYNGAFGTMNSISKYRAAVKELQAEQASSPAPVAEQEAPEPKKAVKKAPSVKTEKAKIEQARKDEEYKEKAAKREAKITQQRKKAASMSKKKPKAKPKVKFDPMKLEGEELDAHMEYLMSGGRN